MSETVTEHLSNPRLDRARTRNDTPILALVDHLEFAATADALFEEVAEGDFDFFFIFSDVEPWKSTYENYKQRGFNVARLDDVLRDPSIVAHCAGITSIGDGTLRQTSLIAAANGLSHFHSPEVADRISEKEAQRTAFSAHGVPQPEWQAVDLDDPDWWMSISPTLAAGPMVAKPSRGWASSGVARVENLEQAREVLAAAEGRWLIEAEIGGGEHPVGDWLGDCVSVQTMSYDGKHQLFGVMDKPPTASRFRGTGDIVPSLLPESLRKECEAVALAAIDALGIRDGWSHTELKLSATGPQVLEVNGRMTSTIHDASRRMYRSNPMKDWFGTALGQPPHVTEFDYNGEIVCQYLPPAPSTPVAADDVRRIAVELEKHPNVFQTKILRLDTLDGSSDQAVTTTPMSVWIQVADARELHTVLDEVRALLAEVNL